VTGQLALFKNNQHTRESWRDSIENNKLDDIIKKSAAQRISEESKLIGFDERIFSPLNTPNLTVKTHQDTQSGDLSLMMEGRGKICDEFRGPVYFSNGIVADRQHEYVLHHYSRIKYTDSTMSLSNANLCQNFSMVRFYSIWSKAETLRRIHQVAELLDILRFSVIK